MGDSRITEKILRHLDRHDKRYAYWGLSEALEDCFPDRNLVAWRICWYDAYAMKLEEVYFS